MQIFKSATAYAKTRALQIRAMQNINNPANFNKSSKAQNAGNIDAENKQQRIEALRNKLKSGKKLSSSEMEFLRENSPELYEKAVKIMKEREDYARRLRNCKTKENVRRLQMEKSQQLSAEAKSISSEELQMKISAMFDEHTSFLKKPEYYALPEYDDEEKEKHVKSKSASCEELNNPPFQYKDNKTLSEAEIAGINNDNKNNYPKASNDIPDVSYTKKNAEAINAYKKALDNF